MPLIVNRIPKSRKPHTCDLCGKQIPKGSPYYRNKQVDFVEGRAYSNERKVCPQCRYTNSMRQKRFESFKSKCQHPMIDTVYRYIPGECVQEPDYNVCLVCGKKGC